MSNENIGSRFVTLKAKVPNFVLPGEILEDMTQKVGGSLTSGGVPRSGLSPDEEKLYLPDVIGISTNSPTWNTEVRKYWNNITKIVPYPNGIELQIGMKETEIGGKKTTFPINLNDYVLWRYLMVYNQCANNKEESKKSNKIRFYLEDKQTEVDSQRRLIDIKNKASLEFIKVTQDERALDDILLLMFDYDETRVVSTYDSIDGLTISEKIIELDKFVSQTPSVFYQKATDKQLVMKAFITRCISKGFLQKIPNTGIIVYDNEEVGVTIQDAVIFLTGTTAKAKQIYTNLIARMKVEGYNLEESMSTKKVSKEEVKV